MAATRLGVGLVNIRWGTTPPIWASLHLATRCSNTTGGAICTAHVAAFTDRPSLEAHITTGDHALFWGCAEHGPEALEKPAPA